MSRVGYIELSTYGRVEVDRDPDYCPHCNKSVSPEQRYLNCIEFRGKEPTVELVCECPDFNCGRIFTAVYTLGWQSLPEGFPGRGNRQFRLRQYIPTFNKVSEFPEAIRELSPLFVSIYQEAESAEAASLLQVCGLGYRKALEFLIKDYCSHLHPNREVEIKETMLSACIKEFVDDANVKSCAVRATWLGNDEAHYVRKWENKDIEDLKTLVRLTCNWVENNILTAKYVEDMPRTAPLLPTAAIATEKR